MKKLKLPLIFFSLLLILFSCDNHQHVWENPVTTVEPTCTEQGIVVFTCSCGETFQTSKPVLGHDLIFHQGQDATCTEIGWEAYSSCSRCTYTTYNELQMIPHSYNLEDGKDIGYGVIQYVCQVCTNTIEDLTNAYGILNWSVTIPTVNIDYEYVVFSSDSTLITSYQVPKPEATDSNYVFVYPFKNIKPGTYNLTASVYDACDELIIKTENTVTITYGNSFDVEVSHKKAVAKVVQKVNGPRLSLSCKTPDVTIKYKINDSAEKTYSKPFLIKDGDRVVATATKPNYVSSSSDITYDLKWEVVSYLDEVENYVCMRDKTGQKTVLQGMTIAEDYAYSISYSRDPEKSEVYYNHICSTNLKTYKSMVLKCSSGTRVVDPEKPYYTYDLFGHSNDIASAKIGDDVYLFGITMKGTSGAPTIMMVKMNDSRTSYTFVGSYETKYNSKHQHLSGMKVVSVSGNTVFCIGKVGEANYFLEFDVTNYGKLAEPKEITMTRAPSTSVKNIYIKELKTTFSTISGSNNGFSNQGLCYYDGILYHPKSEASATYSIFTVYDISDIIKNKTPYSKKSSTDAPFDVYYLKNTYKTSTTPKIELEGGDYYQGDGCLYFTACLNAKRAICKMNLQQIIN